MSRKITLPPYEQMILQIGTFSAEQLENETGGLEFLEQCKKRFDKWVPKEQERAS